MTDQLNIDEHRHNSVPLTESALLKSQVTSSLNIQVVSQEPVGKNTHSVALLSDDVPRKKVENINDQIETLLMKEIQREREKEQQIGREIQMSNGKGDGDDNNQIPYLQNMKLQWHGCKCEGTLDCENKIALIESRLGHLLGQSSQKEVCQIYDIEKGGIENQNYLVEYSDHSLEKVNVKYLKAHHLKQYVQFLENTIFKVR